TAADEGVGIIAFSPLAQGLLTGKYLDGIPGDSRAARGLGNGSMTPDRVTPELVAKLRALNEVARARGQSLAQMALAWLLRDPRVTSAVIGASRPEQVVECVGSLRNLAFADDELLAIERALATG